MIDGRRSKCGKVAAYRPVPVLFYNGRVSWTDDQLDRLRDKLVLARRTGEWLTAADISIVLGLVRWWKRATLRSGWNGISDGLPPTIADMRGQGITHVFVACANPACHSGQRRIALDALTMPGRQPVPEHATFADLRNRCRFRCLRCNGRWVNIMADWPDRGGAGGAHGQSTSLPQ